MSSIQKIKGFADIFGEADAQMTRLENTARDVFERYGYRELRTPLLEKTELFCRGIGDETDVVQKEMYTFDDRKGRSVTLRPEATAGVMRAYIENKFNAVEQVSRFFTLGPMFRYERPQKGRMRQFHQINAECIGPSEPHADAEVILMLLLFLRSVGLSDLSLEINTLGCRECRPAYHEALRTFLAGLDPETLCEDCRRRMNTNPLRVLDCKVSTCKEQIVNAPTVLDNTCPECKEHFQTVLGVLDKAGQAYHLNHKLVRGLDYYMRTTFEVVSTNIGAQSSVAGGGRYDGLVKQLGGGDVPGVGFACGMERLMQLMEAQETRAKDFYLAVLGPEGLDAGVMLAQQLREAGLAGEMGYGAKSVKSQMRQAGKSDAKFTLLLGADELAQQQILVKNMTSGEQTALATGSDQDLAALAQYLKPGTENR